MDELIYRVANMINYGLSRNEAVSTLISEGTSPEVAWMVTVAAKILIDKGLNN